MGDAPDQEATRDALPDMLLVPAEVVSQLAWLGHLPLLLNKPTLKLALSLHCQICGERFSCPTLLTGHLADRHSEVIRDLQDLTDLVAWLLFAEYGCVCNPSVHHNTPDHFCPMQIQIAYLISNSGHRIIVPWCYRTTDLMDIFETLLPGPTLKKIATMFMSRQFEQLLHAPEIFQLLSRRCIWCDETVELKHAMAHLRVAHSFDIQRLQVIIRQLAAVATQDHQGFWCSFCGELLPSGEHDNNISPLPEKHMQQFTYIKLVALMLSYPVWHKKAYQPYQ